MAKKKTEVHIKKTSPESVLKDYSKLMRKADYEKYLPKNKETIIKINLSWSLFFPSCSTPPWQLDGVVKTMLEDKYSVIPAENKTVVTKVMKGAVQNAWIPVLEKHGLELLELPKVKWKVYKPRSNMIAIPEIFPKGLRIPEIFKGKNVVHVPTMKTHGHTTITGAVKNAFGGLITERRHHSHKLIHEVLVDLLQIQKEIHPGIFCVMDATVCGDGRGPRTMQPKIKNLILASHDSVAIDAIAAKMMGFDPMKIGFIKISHDMGLGCGDPDQIDVVGEDISKTNFRFSTGKSPVIFWDQMLRKGKLKFLEPLLFHTPLFKLPVFASGFYHDSLWYPLKGRSIVKKFMKTGWGKLFLEYQKT